MSGLSGAVLHPDIETLRRLSLFRDLDDSLLRRLAAVSEVIAMPEGSRIGQQGERTTRLYVILSGQVALANRAPNGESAIVEVQHADSHLFLATSLSGLPLLFHGQVVNDARLLAMDVAAVSGLIQTEPTLATAFLRAEAMEFRSMVRQVCDLKLRTTAQRLGCYLLALTKEQGAKTASLRLPFDKRLLAARLGCRQENLSRAFAALRSFGVETHGSRVILHDIPKLKDYSVPDDAMDAEPA